MGAQAPDCSAEASSGRVRRAVAYESWQMTTSKDTANHLSLEQLNAGLDHIRRSPADGGTLLMVVQRPDVDQRNVVEEGRLDVDDGLVGDTWKDRGSASTADGSANPAAQVTVINSRAIQLMARSKDRWPLAGDQLVIDIDISEQNLPAGTRLSVGAAVIEISAEPHTGCLKFANRFGSDALRFVSTRTGQTMRLRGVNARVVKSGAIRAGDVVARVGL